MAYVLPDVIPKNTCLFFDLWHSFMVIHVYMNTTIQKVLILTVWILLIGASAWKPAEARVVKKIIPKVAETVIVATPYSAGEILIFTNEARVTAHVSKLVVDKKLSQAAQAKVEDMTKQNYFGHVSPTNKTVTDFIKSSGYRYVRAGENLAGQYTKADTLMKAWLASPGHRQNLLASTYTDTGIGIAYGEIEGKTGWFVVQIFGSKL